MTHYRTTEREDGTPATLSVMGTVGVDLEQVTNQHWRLRIELQDGRELTVNLNTKTQRIFASVEVEG